MKIAVYGTLRKDMHNFERFKDGLEYLDTVEIRGFDLYDLGLPMIIPGEGTVVFDLLNVTSPHTDVSIDLMELTAGYRIDTVIVDGEVYKIYPHANEEYVKRAGVLTNGDWIGWTQIEETLS